MARRIVRDWLDGQLPRSEAFELTGATDAEFALGTYIETHEPASELVTAVAPLGRETGAEAPLADAVGSADEFL
jgi:hypothetical protein